MVALRNATGGNSDAITGAVTAVVGLVVPVVTTLAIGIAYVVLGLMGRSLAPLSWFGW
jgi:hypothetical protein